MTKYKIAGEGVSTETIDFIPNDPDNKDYQKYESWLSLGNTPDPQFTEEELIEKQKLEQINQIDIDYLTTQQVPVICTVNDIYYYMDSKEDSARRFKAGIDLAELMEETEIDIVDSDNNVHNVTITQAKEINRLQSIKVRENYLTRAIARNTILNS